VTALHRCKAGDEYVHILPEASSFARPNRTGILAGAATAIGAVGFLTVPVPAHAVPMLPLAPACTDYRFPGVFILKQSEAGKQFRRVNGHLHLPSLRAALERETAESVGPIVHNDQVSAA
jgi:hypothetical protein